MDNMIQITIHQLADKLLNLNIGQHFAVRDYDEMNGNGYWFGFVRIHELNQDMYVFNTYGGGNPAVIEYGVDYDEFVHDLGCLMENFDLNEIWVEESEFEIGYTAD